MKQKGKKQCIVGLGRELRYIYSVSSSPGSDVARVLQNAVLNRSRQVKVRTPARSHLKNKECVHCQEMMRRSIVVRDIEIKN